VVTLEEMFVLAIERRDAAEPVGSTGTLLAEGVDAIGKKLLEEAAESWIAARHEGPEQVALELSQVLYYVALLATRAGVGLDELYERL
jgi:phosphoribosyl-ATP pyrophosphohydrolase